MITQLKVNGFKSLKNLDLTFNKGINIIVGPNGAGKTNICQALGLMAAIVNGSVNEYLLSLGGINASFCNSKTSKSCNLEQPKSMELGIVGLAITNTDGTDVQIKYEYDVKISLNEDSEVILEERLRFLRLSKHNRFIIVFDSYSDEKRNLHINIRQPKLIGPIGIDLVKDRRKYSLSYESWDSCLDLLGSLYFYCHKIKLDISKLKLYNIDPHLAKKPSNILESSDMLSDGKRLPNAIFELYKNDDTVSDIQNFMAMILPKFSSIQPETSNDGSTRSFSIIDDRGFKCEAPAISDGTVKTIALLVGIHSQKHSSVIIEEPENYLHPWACQSMIEYLRENFSVGICILTSHSETILNAAKPSEIIVCENIEGITTYSRIKNIRELEKIIATSGMGCGYHYVTGSMGGVPL